MAAHLVTPLVLVASLLPLFIGTAAAQSQCCIDRLRVCGDDAILEWAHCNNDCYGDRLDALERCKDQPSPVCTRVVELLYARCQLRCDHDRLHDGLFCLVRYRNCVNNELGCRNTPTATRTFTRTQTPSPTPPGSGPNLIIGLVPTPTPTPPTAPR